ncbi:MAG TPA: acyl--CoA ligase [Ktedonosporobacter sp.]|jgi:acyl-CoA synthetase (AMP-forming)/AMP-acid ligase II|nr:acyl--CoA ligase [Ktedonosporobacter sp.]
MPTLLDVLNAGHDQHVAIITQSGLTLTYRQLRDEVTRAAEHLSSCGVRPGERVGMVYPNSAEAIVLFLAAAVAGTAAPLNPSYKREEFAFYLEDTRARVLLVPPGGYQAAREALPAGGMVIEAGFDESGTLRLEPMSQTPSLRGGPTAPKDDDVALVLHTSGTTSRPKIVPLRHRNLAASVANIIPSYKLTEDDVSLCVMPLFHVHGLVASALATFGSGGTVVVPQRFSPFEFWGLLGEHRVTWYSAVPTIHQMIVGRASHGKQAAASSLRFARSCSSALSPQLMGELEALLDVPVLQAYGMTEASHQMASNPLPPGSRQPGSVGVGTGVEIAILDEHCNLLPVGAVGEVAVRGPNVMDGYEANPAATSAAFCGDWFRTGDQGTLDQDGYLTLQGRIKELIIRGGEKIAPREIDEVLESHPAVAEAVTFGLPHKTWGEEVAAAVVLKGEVGKRDLTDFCRQRLADFKIPSQFFFVDDIPRTSTGKIQRRHVAAAFTEGGTQ